MTVATRATYRHATTPNRQVLGAFAGVVAFNLLIVLVHTLGPISKHAANPASYAAVAVLLPTLLAIATGDGGSRVFAGLVALTIPATELHIFHNWPMLWHDPVRVMVFAALCGAAALTALGLCRKRR